MFSRFEGDDCEGDAEQPCALTYTSDTLRALEEAVANFVGCAVVVSHDRWFLDRLATHILAFEGDGYVHWCEGNFETYDRERRERLGEEADTPQHFRYKKLQKT